MPRLFLPVCFVFGAMHPLLSFFKQLTETCVAPHNTHHIINKAFDEWRKPLRFCVSAVGEHFSHSWRM